MYQYNPIGNGPESPTLSNHVKKTPQPLAFTSGQHQEDLTAGEASDSGDSLFVTQKPVPDDGRLPRRRRHGKRSCLAYSRYLEESQAESSASSSSQEEPRTDKCSNGKKSCLPKYTFSFLAGNRPKDTALPAKKNRVLHTFAVAGFFKCLNEFSAKTSLPRVGTDDEDISPLSEEEEEKSHVHGFRVVDKKCFATSLKATSCQTWCNQREQHENASSVGEKTLQERQLKMKGKTPAEASTPMEIRLSWHSKRSNNVVPSANFLSETEGVDKLMPNTALKPTISLTLGAKEACRDDNSNIVVCEPLDVDGDWEVHNESQTGETVDTRGHHFLRHTTPSNNNNYERICIGPRVKKTKDQTHASVEGQRPEEPEGRLGSVTLEKETRRPQTTEEIVSNKRILLVEKTDRQERTSRKHSKWKERKTKAANIVRVEYLESDVMITDSIISPEGGGKKKNDDISHSEWSSTANGILNGAEGEKIQHKENKDLCAHTVEKDAQTPREHISFQAEVQDTQSAEIITNLEHADYLVKKKKRKRKLGCKDA